VAEPGRGILLDHHPAGPAVRQLPTVADLVAAIERFIPAWNDRCRPFSWTKDLDTVIAKATHPRRRKASNHVSYSALGRRWDMLRHRRYHASPVVGG